MKNIKIQVLTENVIEDGLIYKYQKITQRYNVKYISKKADF